MISNRFIKELPYLKSELTKETNIYYFNNDENITKGIAFMFGPKDTPYEYIPMEYSIEIPNDYPFIPPKVLYKTNDGNTRFHPNFYIDGKVCLSILGTYSGPKWVSSMNIKSVLLSIYSLLTNNPLTHEPSYENTSFTNPRNYQYTQYVEHQIIKLFYNNMKKDYYKIYMTENEEFKETILKNYDIILSKIKEKAQSAEIIFSMLPYSMNGYTSWNKLIS